MDNFGSEIGQKMRSAVKAKLLELGTGGSAGYIDDELPDYVMIMVANKRSKQQMIADLNLFLGSQTDLFVTWLHEVLQKLQEVTLPAATATAKKRKSNQKEDAASKKDKRSAKKEKKTGKKSADDNVTAGQSGEVEKQRLGTPSTSAAAVPVINSITDVFAEELLEKAKKTMDVTTTAAAQIKKGKGKKANEAAMEPPEEDEETNEFDIPTMSEISSTTGGGPGAAENNSATVDREKDLAELADIQKKIYAAKKHLKQIGELNDDLESEDEDFLNLKDDGSADEFNEVQKQHKSTSIKEKSPIVFDNNKEVSGNEEEAADQRRRHTPSQPASGVIKPTATAESANRSNNTQSQSSRPSRERERREPPAADSVRKRPVHERLGMKPQSREPPPRERRVRQEKELYVPAFRRKELDSDRDRDRDKDREQREQREHRRREHDRERGRPRDRERERERGRGSVSRTRGELETRHRHASPQQPTSSSAITSAVERHMTQSSKIVIPSNTSSRKRAHSTEDDGPPRQRMGSRVIVAPPKTTEPSDDEDMKEKPVNSVIKIKPRQPMSPSKQACKNLLLRAMAEAQRSTILAKNTTKKETTMLSGGLKVRARLGERKAKLSIRDRLKRNVAAATVGGVATIFRRTTQNLVIEVKRGSRKRATIRKRRQAELQHEEAHLEQEEYVPESVTLDRGESDLDYGYVPGQTYNESTNEQSLDDEDYKEQIKIVESDYEGSSSQEQPDAIGLSKTQFVVTLNDDKSPAKYKTRAVARSRSASPLPQVSSSSSASRINGAEASSTTSTTQHRPLRHRSREARKSNIRSRLSAPAAPTPSSRQQGRNSSNSSPASNTPPPRRTELIEIYRKPKDIKKIIIQNDSEDEELSSPKKAADHTRSRQQQQQQHNSNSVASVANERSTTPPLPPKGKRSTSSHSEKRAHTNSPQSPKTTPQKRKRTPIRFDLDREVKRADESRHSAEHATRKRRSKSVERERDNSSERRSGEERRKISIRHSEARKYDNIPSLSSLESTAVKINKPKERCKYHPNCTKQFCDFYHPTAPCKTFPNCKYADKCMYSHPKCKYDMACTSLDCNFSHSGARHPSQLQPSAPPLSSHVVPVQNYKSISVAPAASSTMCKYYPNCSKLGCTFYHPKLCRFGKNCINKLECNFYHHEVQSSSKFKWVASLV